VWAFTSMYANVCFQITRKTEWLITDMTGTSRHICMYTFMSLQQTLRGEWFITYVTDKRHCPTVYTSFMLAQIAQIIVRFITHVTGIQTNITMDVLMALQSAPIAEWLAAHTADIRTLSSVYAFMSLQMALPTEWFITYLTGKQQCPTVYISFMTSHITLFTVWFPEHMTWMLVAIFIHSILQEKPGKQNVRNVNSNKNACQAIVETR